MLSFPVPGLGHVYAGRPGLGGTLYAAAIVFPVIAALAGFQTSFSGLMAFAATEIVFSSFVIVHSAITASRAGAVELKAYQRWYMYILIMCLALGLILAVQFTVERRMLGISAFKIPSGSMEPTLLVGDHLIVDLKSYRDEGPQRGDIAVFSHPKARDKYFIKRVVAVGGDVMALRDGSLYINGEPVSEPYVREPDENGPDHTDIGPVTIRRGKVYVLGDNRMNSYDSREWGVLDVDKLVGKALYIYWSWDSEHLEPRMERIGLKLR